MIRDHLACLMTVVRLMIRPDPAASSHAVLYECRHCGTKLNAGADACPVCDSIEIASYDLWEICQ